MQHFGLNRRDIPHSTVGELDVFDNMGCCAIGVEVAPYTQLIIRAAYGNDEVIKGSGQCDLIGGDVAIQQDGVCIDIDSIAVVIANGVLPRSLSK